MSILMDDIIWTILLIMYDYLFFVVCLAWDAIDLQLQQLKKYGGGGVCIAIACSQRGHQQREFWPVLSRNPQMMLKPFTKSSHRRYPRPRQRLFEAGKTGIVFFISEMKKKKVKFREAECFAQGHTAHQNQEFKYWLLTLKKVLISLYIASQWDRNVYLKTKSNSSVLGY